MKIIITASSDKIDQPFNPRFGRAEYFILIDSETRETQAFSNPAAGARGGAGPQAVQFIASQQPEIIISGRFGPNAFSALEAAGIKAYIANNGTVGEVLDQFLAGQLSVSISVALCKNGRRVKSATSAATSTAATTTAATTTGAVFAAFRVVHILIILIYRYVWRHLASLDDLMVRETNRGDSAADSQHDSPDSGEQPDRDVLPGALLPGQQHQDKHEADDHRRNIDCHRIQLEHSSLSF